MRRALSLFTISVCLFAAACASTSGPAPPFKTPPPPSIARAALAVVVTNSVTGVHVSSADVSLHTGERGDTNSDGYVEWKNLELGGRGITIRAAGYHDKFFSLDAFTGNTQVPIALEPIALVVVDPIDTPITPPWKGQLRKARDDLGFQDTEGRWVLPVCAHYGEAFSAFVHGKNVNGIDVAAQLRRIKAAGYDCIRFWDVLGYYDRNKPGQLTWSAWYAAEVTPWSFVKFSGETIEATPNYYGRLRDFIALLQRLGLTAFHSRGDLNAIRLDLVLAHTARVAAIYDELQAWPTLALAEGNNENWQNGAFSSAELAQIVAPFRQRGALVAHSTPEQGEEPDAMCELVRGPPAASIYTVHGLRNGPPTQILEHIFYLGYFGRAPDWTCVPRLGIQGEPGGPGRGVSTISESNRGAYEDPEMLTMMAATSAISRQWWVYMSGHGVFWKGEIDTQPGFRILPRMRQAIADFAPDVMSWNLYHGGRVEAALRSPTGYEGDPGNVEGPARIFNAVRPDRQKFVAIIEGGHRTKRMQNMLACTAQLEVLGVSDDEQVTRATFTLQPRESMVVEYRVGRVVLGACRP